MPIGRSQWEFSESHDRLGTEFMGDMMKGVVSGPHFYPSLAHHDVVNLANWRGHAGTT